MSEYRNIEIDFEIHKRIEANRTSFAESPNTVLRRLLGVREKSSTALGPVNGGQAGRGRAWYGKWSGKGVSLPHGTDLQMNYNGRQHTGVIENGEWLVEGKRYKSPSGAADEVTGKSLNGWNYWRVRRPGDTSWFSIKKLPPHSLLDDFAD